MNQHPFVAPTVQASHLTSYPHRDIDPRRENLFRLGQPMRDALLVSVAQELLERRAVLLDPEGEGVAEHVSHLAGVGREPRQRIARDRGIEQTLEAAAL